MTTQTDEISHLLSRDPLMCPYGVVAKDCRLPEIVDTYPTAIVCNTHDADRPGEHWIAVYVNEIGDYFDPYGLQPQHIEFTNFMNEQCSELAPNDRRLHSTLSTVCGQYCVAFLTLRCRNVSMHAFTCLFTCLFDWIGDPNKKTMTMCGSLRSCSCSCCLDAPLIGATYLECVVPLLDFDIKHTGLRLSSARGSRITQSERRS